MRIKIYLLTVLCLVAAQGLRAQEDRYRFSHLDITNGLSDNQVNCVFKDSKGFMWFGTTSGLNRYDGYKFKVFKRDNRNPNSLRENHVMHVNEGPDNKLWVFTHSSISVYNPVTESFSDASTEVLKYKIPTAQIIKIEKDNYGRYWFVTVKQGVYCYQPQNNNTIHYGTNSGQEVLLHSDHVMDVVVSQPYRLWLIYNDGVIEQVDTREHKVVTSFDGIAKNTKTKLRNYIMTMDSRQNLWVCSDAAAIGAYMYKTASNELVHFSKDAPGHRLNANVITSVIETDDNKLWIGSDHGGINVVDPVTLNVSYIMSKPGDSKSLSGNSLYLYKDNTGIIWAGTFKQGINYYHSGIMQFPLYKHYTADPKSLPYEDINSFAEDAKQNLWIGTNGNGLLYFNRATNIYTRFKHDPQNSNSLSNDIIVRVYIDRDQKLWIGTYFGGLDCYDGKTFTHYRHNEKDPSTLTDDRVYTIIEDAAGDMWVGTFMGGLNVFDRKTNAFRHPKYPMISDYTAVIYEDRDKNKWIGRDKGVDVIEYKTGKVRHYTSIPKNLNSLVGNDVNTIMQDRHGLMWIGTKDGLSILDTKNDHFLNIEEGINLPANNVSNIIEDKEGKMWVSTTNGLSSIQLSALGGKYKIRINNYNELDGLQGRAFNLYAAQRLKSGELVFGGINGFNIFDPTVVSTYKPKPNLLFTDLHLFNKTVAVGDTVNGEVVLKKALSEVKELTLEHDQNVFDIEFATCDYFNPAKVKYEYMLEGFDHRWTVAGPDHKATYTNLDGGDYTFKVRAQDGGADGDQTISLKITVLPPFFKSPVAYLSYFVLLVSMLFYIRHRGILKLKREFEATQSKAEAERKIAQEREEARRMHQLDLMKIKFFTNVSHEFRTPLSLILSPIDNLVKVTEKPEQQNQLLTIKRNGKRLLNLVNQLLDFRKMEYNELKLSLKKGDIIQFIKEVSSSFKDVAQQKRIQFLVESEVCTYITDFDHDKIERILFNLLSNAFKFTPSGGHVSVMVGMSNAIDERSGQNLLEVKVIDTGIGIAKENQERIFERFFQDDMPESLLNQGSGIGLSITKEFVKMQGGSIHIESEPDYGSCFTVTLPVGVKYDEQSAPTENLPEEFVTQSVKQTESAGPGAGKKPTILLIEDNDDLRFYLKDNLKNSFHIVEAANGKDGWQKALAMHPKLIVSDISMPEMNGIDLCKKIKADTRTAEIPVILLTALGTEENQLAGLDSGANDYIVKPFNFEILLSKIHNSLRMQQTFKQTYKKQLDVNAKDIKVISEDEKFLKNALEYIEKNITNINFSVEELARNMNLSRVSLYKKMLTLTGKTPVDCIRTIRLKRAVQLLEKSKLSIASVAYEVGFNNAAYFAKVFREEYGMLPSEYISQLRSNEKAAEPVA